MLTDDDLSQELRAAFRESTIDLSYASPVPRPRASAAWLAFPVAAAAAVAVPVLMSGGGAGPTAAPDPMMVTDTFELAGRTVTYERAADAPRLDGECTRDAVLNGPGETCFVIAKSVAPGEVPAEATPVQVEGIKQAWLLTQDGVTTLYLGGLDEGDYVVIVPPKD